MRAGQSAMRAAVRSTTALIMLAYVVCHLGNHTLLLVSIPLAQVAHHYLIDPWRTVPGTLLLLASVLLHYGNALWSIYVRRALVLPRWGWWQLGLGLSIPLILLLHVSDTRIAEEGLGITADYEGVLLRQWVLMPWRSIAQAIFLAVVWAHAALGIHFWLRTKRWYLGLGRWPAVFALLWPTLALAGFVSAGNEVLRRAQQAGYVPAEMANIHLTPAAARQADLIAVWLILGHIGLVALAFGGRKLRGWLERRREGVLLAHASGRTIRMQPGATVLEALNEHRVPHAQVCGGRARCTTCRVRIVGGGAGLPAPATLEARALARIGAPEDCRLACQLRPTADLAVAPLLSPSARPVDGFGRAGFSGREQTVTVMFLDLRGSTKLGETRLPYDVLFLLDQFFLEMSTALAATGGHFSQFTGDGLMALYGLDGGAQSSGFGAADAMRGAVEMTARLARLNQTLLPALAEPLRIGIGIHQGEAIVGALGPPGSQILTAIGDTVNTTARLEGLSKSHGDAVIVSRLAAEAAGWDVAGATMEVAALTGRAAPVEFYALAL